MSKGHQTHMQRTQLKSKSSASQCWLDISSRSDDFYAKLLLLLTNMPRLKITFTEHNFSIRDRKKSKFKLIIN